MQVFRLVGFNAEFENVIFLTAMDKGNVVKALGCADNYPDKFFELEFPIPDSTNNMTNRFVKETLHEFLPNISLDFLDNPFISECTEYCLSNLRDVSRFINNFVDRVSMINNKLDVVSYYLLSLIRYKTPSLYDKIRKKDKGFLETKVIGGENCWVIKEGKLTDLNETANDEIIKQMLTDLFSIKRKSETGHDFYRCEFFQDYFNETATKAITEVMMMRMLSADSEDELQKKIEQHTNDEISKQYTIELLEKYNKSNFVSTLLEENNSACLVTNFYKVLGVLNIDNGLKYSDGLTPVEIYNKEYPHIYTYFDEQGNVAFNRQFNYAKEFSEGLACVYEDGKCGFIDKEGKTVIPFEYNWAGSFSEGLACVAKVVKFGFIDKEGKTVIPFEYYRAKSFSGGLALVMKDGKYGFIDMEGKTVLPLEYNRVEPFASYRITNTISTIN